MKDKERFKFLKKFKMFYDVLNSIPKDLENQESFLINKDTPHKQIINYDVNDYGCIGDQFVHDPDILALGCSVTVPIGIPHGLSWPHLIKDELNYSLNVIAYSGSSVQRIVHNAINSMLKYGTPKYVYFLLPSLDRTWISSRDEYTYLKELTYDYVSKNLISDLKHENYYNINNFYWLDSFDEYTSSYSNQNIKPMKDFLDIKRSVPLEYGFQNQILCLISFFSFCKLLDIECFYYSWSENFDEVLLNNQDAFNATYKQSILLNDNSYWMHNEKIDFDPNYYSNNPKHKKFWSIGLDKPESNAHPGMYTHIQFAERFLGRKLSQQTIDNAKC